MTDTVTATLPEEGITPAELLEYIGHHIRAHRVHMGLSQQDLGARVGRTLNTVSHWENGMNWISVPDLFNVAAVFGQPLSAFLPRGAL